jgi:hypothetical protein
MNKIIKEDFNPQTTKKSVSNDDAMRQTKPLQPAFLLQTLRVKRVISSYLINEKYK